MSRSFQRRNALFEGRWFAIDERDRSVVEDLAWPLVAARLVLDLVRRNPDDKAQFLALVVARYLPATGRGDIDSNQHE